MAERHTERRGGRLSLTLQKLSGVYLSDLAADAATAFAAAERGELVLIAIGALYKEVSNLHFRLK